MLALTALAALGFAAIHVWIGRLRFLDVEPRSALLSFAGGVAVAYIFLHVMPELASHQQTFANAWGLSDSAAEAWVYLVALTGLVVFFGLERGAKLSRGRRRARTGEDRVEAELMVLQLVSFAFFNFLLGYLLTHREQTGLFSLAIYVAAMVFHIAISDYGLRQDHKHDYQARTRWVQAAAVLAGWAVGALTEVPPIFIGLLFAFLAGGVVLNVLKEELPEERKSRFWPFAAGTAAFAGLLLMMR
jgi:zinc transporter ZupT